MTQYFIVSEFKYALLLWNNIDALGMASCTDLDEDSFQPSNNLF